MEQPDVPAGTAPSAPVMSARPALSNEVRASLDAIRVARDAARERARRQTVHARLWFAIMLAAAAGVAFAAAPRIARWRHARTQVATRAQQPRKSLQPTAALSQPAAPLPQPAAPSIASPAPVVPAAALQIADAPAAAPAKASDAQPDNECDAAAIRHAPWRLSPDACARAFAVDPTNASLALAVAHASLVRGRFAAADEWARRALALDPKTAEAHVIIARAATATDRADDARAAYQRYLELAPRGWHRAEAHAAVERR